MDNELESRVIDRLMKEAGITDKVAKVFKVGDPVTLVDQVQGLNKGSIYKVTKIATPGKISIANYSPEEDKIGDDIEGEFPVDRFTRFHKSF